MDEKVISIVTVTYNSSRTLEVLLDSLERKSNHKFIKKITIIENDSKDQSVTRDICQSRKKKLPISYIHNQNVGFGTSCNLGAKNNKSKYILFLNPDTELLPNSLELLITHAELAKADIIGGKAINYDNIVHGSAVRSPELLIGLFEFSNLGKIFRINKWHQRFYYKDIDIENATNDVAVDAVSGAYLLITSTCFKELHGFDEKIFMYLEDVDLGTRAKEIGKKVLFCPHSVIKHIGGASSENKYHISHQAWFDSRRYYYKKHFGLLINIILQPLYLIEEYTLKLLKRI